MQRNNGITIGGIIAVVIAVAVGLWFINAALSLLPLLVVAGLVWYFFLGGNKGGARR